MNQRAERGSAKRNDDKRDPERQLEADHDRDRRQRGDRQHVAVREINDPHHAEDQVQPARHQRVDAAEQDPADQQLGHRHDARLIKRVVSNVSAARMMTRAIGTAFPYLY